MQRRRQVHTLAVIYNFRYRQLKADNKETEAVFYLEIKCKYKSSISYKKIHTIINEY